MIRRNTLLIRHIISALSRSAEVKARLRTRNNAHGTAFHYRPTHQAQGVPRQALSGVFKEVMEPTFNDLLLVNGDYIKMFEETYRLLPRESRPISRIVKPPTIGKVNARPLRRRGRLHIPVVERETIIFATECKCTEEPGLSSFAPGCDPWPRELVSCPG
jgi:hypothetical protein